MITMSSGIIVQKYGGSSLATDQQVAAVAERIVRSHREGVGLIVVVSARGTTTDDLIGAASKLSTVPCPRETDQLLATGELAAAALLAIALREQNVPAVSLSGAQAGLRATGRHGAGVIANVDTKPVRDWLQRGYVVVVAGFQALVAGGDIITLDRGGRIEPRIAPVRQT